MRTAVRAARRLEVELAPKATKDDLAEALGAAD
jgi:hypothetical protein